MKNKKTVIIIAIVAVIILGGLTYWWFSKSKPLSIPVSGSSVAPSPSPSTVDSSAITAHNQIVAPVSTDSYSGIPLFPGTIYSADEIYNAKIVADDSQHGDKAIVVYINSRKAGDSHSAAIAKEQIYVASDPAI